MTNIDEKRETITCYERRLRNQLGWLTKEDKMTMNQFSYLSQFPLFFYLKD